MKRSLAIAAGLLGLGLTSLAPSVKADGEMFDVTASSPGTILFSGNGTAQFNNSLGTSNSFQVGSSTNLGVNGSVSSTAGYDVTTTADLTLGGSTALKQVIGTSGTAQSRVNTQAHDAARTAMSSWEAQYGSSWETANQSNWAGGSAEWQRSYDSEYERKYATAITNQQSSETDSSNNGTISGSFKTVESGTARSSGNAADWGQAASLEAESEFGVEYDATTTYADASIVDKDSWQAAYDSSYNNAYASASASSNRYSDSTVNVTGIGSDANVIAADSSTFKVGIVANDSQVASSTSTANGSSGASLATSSFANQSSSSTASGFLQAFGEGG